MRHVIVLALIIFTSLNTSCKKDNEDNSAGSICNVKNPLSNLSWLKSKVDSLKRQGLTGYVRSYNCQGQEIISIQAMIQSCYPCSLYTCSGRELNYTRDSAIVDDIMQNIDELKIVAEF